MKFTKQLEFYKIPEWSEYYFNYAYFKKILKRLAKKTKKNEKQKEKDSFKEEINSLMALTNGITEHEPLISPNSNLDQSQKESNKENFSLISSINEIPSFKYFENFSSEEKIKYLINEYKKQLEIIQNFFFQKIKDFKSNFENLKAKIQNYNMTSEIKSPKREISQNEEMDLSQERDEFGYAVSYKRAISYLYNQTSWLHSYFSINSLTIQKFKKKAKKKMNKEDISNIDSYFTEADKEFKFFTSLDLLVKLRKDIQLAYSSAFTENNIRKATNELESRMKGVGKLKHAKIIFFCIGVIISCLAFFILIEFIKTKENESLAPFFPAFNFSFVIIEIIFGIAGNIVILRKYGINYIYIFDIEPQKRLGFYEILQNSVFLLSIWMIILVCFKLSLYFGLFWNSYTILPTILNLFLLIFLFFPFHCSYYNFRRGIILILVRNLFPFGKNAVKFRDFLFGDVLTSLNKPFASLILSFCVMSCLECKTNSRGNCNRNSYGCLIVLFAPFLIRFNQCINRYYYTREMWPHLGNSLKYVGGLANAIFGWYYGYSKKSNTALILHVFFGIVSQSYMLFWDIYMDWNLGRVKSKNFFLRDKIIYPKKIYYSAIIINTCLRFSWLMNLVDISSWMDNEWKDLILAILEAYRRIQWCIFRIENENTNNPEKYRAILEIPALPID